MKSFKVLLLLVLLPFLAVGQYEVKGRIVDKSNGKPLPGAHIRVDGSKVQTVADAEGIFTIQRLPAGRIQLNFSYIGYQSAQQLVTIPHVGELLVLLSETAYLSDEVVVRSSRVNTKSPATYSVVDKKNLENENTGYDLPYLLQMTPSVVVNSDAGAGIGYTGIRIRGSDLTRINVTMNGVPVNDPESHGVFFVNLPDLASSIDNVQIQRGVGTSANGAAAFGASINIQTSSRSQDAFVDFSNGIGSFNTFRNSLNFGTGVSQSGFALDGRLSKISSDGFIDRGWSDLKSYYLAASWASKKTMIKLLSTSGKEQTYQSWYGIPRDSLATNRRYNPSGEMLNAGGEIIGYYDNQTDNYQQDYYQLHFAHHFSNSLLLTGATFLTKGKGYYESWKNNQRFSKFGLADITIGNQLIRRTDLIQQKWLDNDFYGFNLAAIYETDKMEVTLGSGWNRYQGDHFGLITWAKFASAEMLKSPWYFNKGDKTDFSSFAKINWNATDKIMLFSDLQLRLIEYSIDGTHDNLLDITQQHRFRFFNPKAGIYYQIGQGQGIYASVAVSNREPNRSVYRDADSEQLIKPERLLNIETGYRKTQGRAKVEGNLFYMKYKDQLVLTGKINNVGAAIMSNVAESYRIGVESAFGYVFSNQFDVQGHLSVSENKILRFTEYVDNWNFTGNPADGPNQYSFDLGKTDISFSPSVVAGFTANIQPIKTVTLAYQSTYVSRQYIDNTSSISRSLDPYHVGNVRIIKHFPVKHLDNMSLQLHLNNIFNTKYEANGWVYKYFLDGQEQLMDGYFPQAGFHWMAQLNIGF